MNDMTYEILLKKSEEKLQASGILEASLSAWYIFHEVFGIEKSKYFLEKDIELKKIYDNMENPETYIKEKLNLLESYIDRRAKREPLEYILGYTEFMGLKFFVNKDVLIPRQDTEILVEQAIKYSKDKDVLDLCTGSGCIGLSIYKLGQAETVTLSDVSSKALQVTKKNVDFHRANVNLICSDIFEKIEGKFDLIVSNPPYIPSKTIEELMPEVRDFEPILALDGREDGLFFYEKIVKESKEYLKDNGKIIFEIGYDQAFLVENILKKHGFKEIKTIKDLAGLDRVVIGEK